MSDLQVGEAFKDKVYLIETATGNPHLLQNPTCTVIDESGNRAVGVVAEESDGWYTCSFTPDANGTWSTEWANAGSTIYFGTKIFKVGGGEIADIKADTAAILTDTSTTLDNLVDDLEGYHTVPAQNAVANAQMRDAIGNKTDDPTWFTDDVSSLMKFAKAGVSTGGGLTYSGKCDTGMAASTTTIVCDDLKGFGDDFFNTDWVMTVNLNDNSHGASPEGDAPRDITDYTSLTGTFVVTAFGSNVEAEDKIIIQRRGLHTTDAIGLKTTPATNSLAYCLSAFLADGDGDFATGTKLPSNISLYDLIGGANGHSAFPAAAAPANGVNLMAVAHLIADRTEHHEVTKTFFSATDDLITCNTDSSDLTLPAVVLPNIAGTITHVYAGVKFRMIENTNAATNGLNGAQDVQVKEDAAGAYVDAINLVDNQWLLAASTREGGDCVIGTIDIVAQVAAFNKTYDFIIDNNDVDQANLNLCDVQTFLIVSYY